MKYKTIQFTIKVFMHVPLDFPTGKVSLDIPLQKISAVQWQPWPQPIQDSQCSGWYIAEVDDLSENEEEEDGELEVQDCSE